MKFDLKYSIGLFILVFILGIFVGSFYEKAKAPNVVEYACSDKKTIGVQYYGEKVHIGLSDGREYTLPQVVSASGARYTNQNESIVLWNKGDEVTFQENAIITYSSCVKAGA